MSPALRVLEPPELGLEVVDELQRPEHQPVALLQAPRPPGQGLRELAADRGRPDDLEVPGREGGVVPVQDVTLDRGLALQVQARHFPAQGLEGPADAPGAGEEFQQPHFIQGSSGSSQGLATSQSAATTPASSRAAQRNSPKVAGLSARSGAHIFNVAERKPEVMSAQSAMAMQLGNIQTNSKGGKYLPLRGQGGDPPTWKSEWLKVLWNPSCYGDPEAVCLEPDEAAKSFFLEVEDQLAAQLSEHSSRDQRIFGKFLQPEDVKQRMVSALKVSTRGTEFLKLKLNWEKAQLWGPAGEEIPRQPLDLQGCHCKLRVELRQVWLMTSQCGVLAEITDVMLQQQEPPKPSCPF